MPEHSPLVTTNWLAENLEDPGLRVLDASWLLPGEGDAGLDYARRHIPGALFFDIDKISDAESPLPHMLPPPETFSEQAGQLGVDNDTHVIFYDDEGIFSAARGWWMFRAMGHEKVSVLDGGLVKWRREHRPVDGRPVDVKSKRYSASPDERLIASAHDIAAAIGSNGAEIVDARPSGRFKGIDTEPRPGLRSGHIPGSINVPYKELLSPTGEMKSPDALKNVFESSGVDFEKSVFTTCGSGVTAAVLSLAMAVLGYSDIKLYDGSWAEWGDASHDEQDFPIQTGA